MGAGLALGLGEPAHATDCGCAETPIDADDFHWPQRDAVDVPLNAKIWLGLDKQFDIDIHQGPPEDPSDPDDIDDWVELKGPEGTQVPFRLSRIIFAGYRDIVVVSPEVELDPNSSYELIRTNDTVPRLVTRFTTGTQRDDESPPVPVEDSSGRMSERDRAIICAAGSVMRFEVERAPGITVAMLEDAELDFDPENFSGEVSQASFTVDGDISLGRGLCYEGWGDASSETQIRFASFDFAGNFSGWTTSTEVELDVRGCRLGSPGRSGAWFSLAWLGLLWGVRRHSQRDRPAEPVRA